MCEHYIQTNLAMENVFTVLKGAHNLNQKSVKEMCFHFALKNYNAFIGNKDGAKDLGIDLFQVLLRSLLKTTSLFHFFLSLRWSR